jgi:hypothetical protein
MYIRSTTTAGAAGARMRRYIWRWILKIPFWWRLLPYSRGWQLCAGPVDWVAGWMMLGRAGGTVAWATFQVGLWIGWGGECT